MTAEAAPTADDLLGIQDDVKAILSSAIRGEEKEESFYTNERNALDESALSNRHRLNETHRPAGEMIGEHLAAK